ncbi:conserved hypothetical protein [Candidatus Nitrotoga sp. HW29]|uniref:hypothetical protein n=1 Tax=Candidatus Nitrotoga sp. HW29 TaxID=2886963 RepID=UPI001EF30BE1|nr:hypothetical protein [Candidatus Nitrotoga sp. HW29]CAH1905169.1 conserved hypothetical protein [Candidatus Nitrotoga sp. HW29]
MMWDLLLYVPTVVALLSMVLKFWYGGDVSLAYLFSFLASFFFIAGVNRILKTRLMLLPTAPIAIEIRKQEIQIIMRNGEQVGLVKDLRIYADYSGRSFGLAGLNRLNERLQFVFHKGQFPNLKAYQTIQEMLKLASSPLAFPSVKE